MTSASADRLHTWERATVLPLVLLALVFAGTYATQLGGVDGEVSRGASLVRGAVWALFAADYGIRVWLAPYRLRHVLSHPLDLVVIAVPPLRPLLLAVALLVRRKAWLQGRRHVVRRTLVYLVSVSTTLVLFVAVAVVLAEQDAPGANIRTLPDALWWAVVTVTSVGYGELYPVTAAGRAAAVLGMLLGIGVLGTVTATISAQVVAAAPTGGRDPVAMRPEPDDDGPDVALVDLQQVLAEVRALRREVAELRPEGLVPPGPVRPGEVPPGQQAGPR